MIRVACALTVCLAAAPAPARAEDAAARTADEVRAADVAFARLAAEKGVAAAFRATLDADGLAFGGAKPLRGGEAMFRAMGGETGAPFRLAWVPTRAWGSTGGDMGVTTGDWKRTPLDPKKPIATGRYVTVWRRDSAGAWKALIDIGEDDAAPQRNAANP